MSGSSRNPLRYPLRAIAALLAYPEADVQGSSAGIARVLLDRPELGQEERSELADFIAWFDARDLLDIQAEYVETFDRGKKVSLYLFEHVYGESRDRGPAMVELSNAYRRQGLEIDSRELPDYLPMFLEFCAELSEEQSRSWLGETGEIVQQVHVRLAERESRYATPLRVLLKIMGIDSMPEKWVRIAASEERDDTPAALDRMWAEAPVTFGPGAEPAGCGAPQQRAPHPRGDKRARSM